MKKIEEEVFIFNYKRGEKPKDREMEYKKGTLIDRTPIIVFTENGKVPMDYLTVKGEDGVTYEGTDGYSTIGNVYFRTPQEQIEFLQNRVLETQEERKRLAEQIEKYRERIATILMDEAGKQDFEPQSYQVRI